MGIVRLAKLITASTLILIIARLTAWAVPGDTTADAVLGQIDFTHTNNNFGGPETLEGGPGIAIDSQGHLYIADVNRVLGWSNVSTLTNGAPADLVIGQPDFYTYAPDGGQTGGAAANTLFGPDSVAVDPDGNLYVADSGNDRVLEFDQPFASFSGAPITGLSAHLVFGQAESCGSTDGELCVPTAVAVDLNGNLYIADTGNNRVLEYNTPLKVTGVPGSGDTYPDLTFGKEGNFGADSLSWPEGIAIDQSGNVYIADLIDSRVLEYNTPLQTTSVPGSGDTTADQVFDQNGSFISRGCNKGRLPQDVNGIGPDSLCYPVAVAADSGGNLYISDASNNRVLEYNSPLASNGSAVATDASGNLYVADTANNRVVEFDSPFANFNGTPITGLSARLVFGQADDFSSDCNAGTASGDVNGIGPDSLCFPMGVATDPTGNLYISDSANSRLLEYNTPLSASSGEVAAGDTLADAVFGQRGSFTTSACDDGKDSGDVKGVGRDSLCVPIGVAVDASSNVYLTDYFSSRVLEFNAPLNSKGLPRSKVLRADKVFGQKKFTTNKYGGVGQDGLTAPEGVALDPAGDLYVAFRR